MGSLIFEASATGVRWQFQVAIVGPSYYGSISWPNDSKYYMIDYHSDAKVIVQPTDDAHPSRRCS